ncbi:MAG: hypothetical protein F4226_05770 [Synechococcus sp. SB0678_bin_12]|nr:hypothetical protein [Synechococcus sp. SB0678_bin_12]MYI88125.1 hypothetical protein [Synechococcus sp. SB0672_bin_10]
MAAHPWCPLGASWPGHPALLSFLAHLPMDNRHHQVVDSRVTSADGYGERAAAQQMLAAR